MFNLTAEPGSIINKSTLCTRKTGTLGQFDDIRALNSLKRRFPAIGLGSVTVEMTSYISTYT